MELRHVRYFVAFAEEMHFGKAARRLGISQPPLSQQIQSLEHEAGVRLFERSRRHVALTKEGEIFLSEAYGLIRQYERVCKVLKRARTGEVGQLHLAAIGSAFYDVLPPILRRFQRDHSDIGITLRECRTSEAESLLLAGDVDFAFVRLDLVSPPLEMRPLQRETVMVALPKGHRLAKSKSLSLKAIGKEPFVTFARSVSPKFYDSVLAAFSNAGISPNVVHECNSLHSKLGFVACGLGVALVPKTVQAVAMKDVVFRDLSEKIPLVGISVVWNTKKISALGERLLAVVKTVETGRSARP